MAALSMRELIDKLGQLIDELYPIWMRRWRGSIATGCVRPLRKLRRGPGGTAQSRRRPS
jgi:hypothetical protein